MGGSAHTWREIFAHTLSFSCLSLKYEMNAIITYRANRKPILKLLFDGLMPTRLDTRQPLAT